MKILNRLSILLLMALTAAACSKDEENEMASQTPITFIPSIASDSRSAMEAGFEDGDQIGLYLYNGALSNVYTSGVWKSNQRLSLESNNWSSAEVLYWQDVPYSKLSCIAYYPFTYTDNSNNLTSVTFTSSTDQSTLSALRTNDFLWAKVDSVNYKAHANGIPLKMKHLMSKVKVNFTNFPNGISDCRIRKVVCSGTIDILNGSAKSLSSATGKNVIMYVNEAMTTAEVVVLPQTFAAGSLITFVSGEKGYVYTLNEALTLESGSEYTINLDGSTL
jgi:hypothetical protein